MVVSWFFTNLYVNCLWAHPIYFGFGDDRVMRYTEADDVAGGAGEAL